MWAEGGGARCSWHEEVQLWEEDRGGDRRRSQLGRREERGGGWGEIAGDSKGPALWPQGHRPMPSAVPMHEEAQLEARAGEGGGRWEEVRGSS